MVCQRMGWDSTESSGEPARGQAARASAGETHQTATSAGSREEVARAVARGSHLWAAAPSQPSESGLMSKTLSVPVRWSQGYFLSTRVRV